MLNLPKMPGFIYAIGMEHTPYTKIGKADHSVDKRMRLLQVGTPYQLSIRATVYVPDWLWYIERHIHIRLAPYWYRGEWFAVEVDTYSLERLVVDALPLALRDIDKRLQCIATQASKPTKPRRQKPKPPLTQPIPRPWTPHDPFFDLDLDMDLS